MKILRHLQLGKLYQFGEIIFGQPETQEELDSMFRFRFKVYSERGYIDASRFPDGLEKDEYDTSDKCQYFCARLPDGKIIGTVRLILDKVLPTELCYSFDEPAKFNAISREHRGELGRLVIIPPDKDNKIFLPRNLVMLFLLDLLVDYGVKNGIQGGYAFVKTSLKNKLKKIRAPFHYIKNFKSVFTKENVLYRYFTKTTDPVVPGFFFTAEFGNYTSAVIRRSGLFKTTDPLHYVLRANLYTRFLKVLKVI